MSYYPTENLSLNISRGLVKGTSYVHKFGAVDAMSQNVSGTIWDVDDALYPWQRFAPGPLVLIVEAADSGDIEKSITIEGLDENYNLISEVVTTDSNPVPTATTTAQFTRVFRAYVTDTVFADDVNIKRDGHIVARIRVGNAQTLMAIYTIPVGYEGFYMQQQSSVQAGGDCEINTFLRYDGEAEFRVAHSVELTGSGGPYVYSFHTPLRLPPKTDIDIRGSMRSNNARATAAFDLILIKQGLA